MFGIPFGPTSLVSSPGAGLLRGPGLSGSVEIQTGFKRVSKDLRVSGC